MGGIVISLGSYPKEMGAIPILRNHFFKDYDLKTVFECQFGSHIYGTNVETSDLDFKSVYIPDPKDLILQKAKDHLQNNTKSPGQVKNTSSDIDHEKFSVKGYLKLLCEGQTVALDMLFCPQNFVKQKSNVWEEIWFNKYHFIHKGTSAFVGYTRQQAAKYGAKGFRVAALRSTIEFLDSLPQNDRLILHKDKVIEFSNIKSHQEPVVKIVPVLNTTNGQQILEDHFEVCNRQVPFHATVKYAKSVFQKLFDIYGQRALAAEKNEGIDWKALMHAVRVAREAEELLLTANITFPRPEKELLLKIRNAELQYKQVAEIIEEGLQKINLAQEKSNLREKPDLVKAEELLYNIYSSSIWDLLNK